MRGLLALVLVAAVAVGVQQAVHHLTKVHFMVHRSGAVVLSGASTGIGASAAEYLAKRGFTVFAGVRSDADHARIAGKNIANLIPVRLDVTSDESVQAVHDTVQAWLAEDRSRILAAVINNAGIAHNMPVELMPIEKTKAVYDVNVFGVHRLTKTFLPLLRRFKGRVITIGSLAGLIGTPFRSVYAGTKHAIEAFTDSLRFEMLPFGVSVSLIEPGYVRTPILVKTPKYDVTPEERELYWRHLDVVSADEKVFDGDKIDTTDVTDAAVWDALVNPTPQTRYAVAGANGYSANMLVWLDKLLPDRVCDLLVESEMPKEEDRISRRAV